MSSNIGTAETARYRNAGLERSSAPFDMMPPAKSPMSPFSTYGAAFGVEVCRKRFHKDDMSETIENKGIAGCGRFLFVQKK